MSWQKQVVFKDPLSARPELISWHVQMKGCTVIRRRIAALTFSCVVTVTALVLAPVPANADSLRYTIVNADGGVFYRRSPSWDDTASTIGVGVYNGDQVELICGKWGEPIGPNQNRWWHRVRNLTRPEIGEGFVNDRFAATPNSANEPTPGEPFCDGSLYYSPYNGDDITYHNLPGGLWDRPLRAPSPASLTLDTSEWHRGADCNSAYAVPPSNIAPDGKLISILAGWSYGRNGPIMFLAAKPAWLEQIHYILLLDPGTKDDYYTGTCDTQYPNMAQLVADYLAASPENKFVVLAGEKTADYGNPVNGSAHAGIQNKLFSVARDQPIRNGRDIRQQIVVCNYDGLKHEDLWISLMNSIIEKPITATTCPAAPGHSNVPSWHP